MYHVQGIAAPQPDEMAEEVLNKCEWRIDDSYRTAESKRDVGDVVGDFLRHSK